MPLEIGTDKMKKEYKKDTPGQMVDSYIQKDQKTKKENAKKFFSQVFDNPLKGFPYNEEFEVHLKEAVEELPEENTTDRSTRVVQSNGSTLRARSARSMAARPTATKPSSVSIPCASSRTVSAP